MPGQRVPPGLLAIVCAMPSLPEDLVILAAGAKPRSGPNNGKLPWRFVYGMLGAVLVALTLAGRVEIADGQIVVRNPSPLGDPNLDEALTGLAAVRTVPVAQWMAGSPAGFVTAYFERLEAAGVLRPETVWLLFIARRKGYRLADRGYFENLRAALRTAVTGTGPIEPGLAALRAVRRRLGSRVIDCGGLAARTGCELAGAGAGDDGTSDLIGNRALGGFTGHRTGRRRLAACCPPPARLAARVPSRPWRGPGRWSPR
jgi:hypothetical protein